MGLLTPGYWPSTYWPENYWPDDYWPDHGVVEKPEYRVLVCKTYDTSNTKIVAYDYPVTHAKIRDKKETHSV